MLRWHVKIRRWEDVKMWTWWMKMICADVKMRRCENREQDNVQMWRWEGEKMWRWEDEKVRTWEDVKVRRWLTDPGCEKNPSLRCSRKKNRKVEVYWSFLFFNQETNFNFMFFILIWKQSRHVYNKLKAAHSVKGSVCKSGCVSV